MTTSVWSLAEEHKFGRIFFYHLSPFLSTPKNINSEEFFVPSAHSIILDTRFSSLYGSTCLIFILIGLGFRFYSRQSIIYGPTRPPLSIFVPAHCASSTSSSIHPSTSSCCFDILSTTVSLFVLGPLGCTVYPMLTVGLTCTQLSRPLFSGCATYPMLVVGVTCTLSSRSFLFSPSCYFLAKFNVSISFAVVFLQLFEPRHPFLSIGYRHRLLLRSCQCLHGFAIASPLFHYRIPAVIRSPDLWLPLGFSVSSLSFPSPQLFYYSIVFLSRRNLVFSASLFIPISAFLSSLSISGVLAAQPASSFLASVYSTVVLLSAFLPPRLISDFLCPSQLLPFFSLYSLLMARLWRFGFLFCSSVSSLSRASVLRRQSIDRRFLPLRFVISDHRFLFRPVTLLFYGLCYCRFLLLDGSLDMYRDRSGARS